MFMENTDESRVTQTILVVDLTNSTHLKVTQHEASWLSTYLCFFSLLQQKIRQFNGTIVKYTGDGVMAAFETDDTAEAINCAIEIQESIAEADANRHVSCQCSIGMSHGEMQTIQFDGPQGVTDYIGTVPDRAFRLCSAANAKAIFVDLNVIDVAQLTKIRSRLGQSMTPKRTVPDYRGEKESVRVKGVPGPVEYHEIKWAQTSYGVRAEFVTTLSNERQSSSTDDLEQMAPSVGNTTGAMADGSSSWTRGYVHNMDDRYGFIRSDGEDFWFNRYCLFQDDLALAQGDPVWFLTKEPYPGKKNRRATHILPMGATLTGVLGRIGQKGFGFVRTTDRNGDSHEIFVFLGDVTQWSEGMRIEFTVGSNHKGIAAENPRSEFAEEVEYAST